MSNSAKAARRYMFAGLSASFIGIGLARFAYSPLLPAVIQAHWFPASAAVYLGAANLTGYLLGALMGRALATRITSIRTLRMMEVFVTLSLLACAFPVSVAWYFAWRLLSGIAGGAIMVLVAATVLPHFPDSRKGIASGAVFLGVGLGIAASGTIVPLLLRYGLSQAWLGLAALSAALTVASWSCWPARNPVGVPAAAGQGTSDLPAAANIAIGVLYAIYALMALGLVAAMLFLVDFVARDLGTGPRLASLAWIIYGTGALVGPPLYGFLADRFGASVALRWLLLVQALALAGLATCSNLAVAAGLIFVIGSFPPGIVPLVIAWIRETLPNHDSAQNVVWSRATVVFAAFQAGGGYAFSALYDVYSANHRIVFTVSAVAIAIALLIELLAARVIRLTRERCRMA